MNYITDLTKEDIADALLRGVEVSIDKPYMDDDVLIHHSIETEIVKIFYFGRLDEIKFLKRLYPLNEMESFDKRFPSFESDILQHRYNNNDWNDGWIFFDERLSLMKDDEHFLNFLKEVFNPYVRDEHSNWKLILNKINEYLKCDGYELYEDSYISGRAIYAWRRIEELKETINEEMVFRIEKGSKLGTIFNKYEVVKQIGQGGNGTVYEAFDQTGHRYAIKVLNKGEDTSKEKRFLNEIYFCLKHPHPNIIDILDYGIVKPDLFFYVMPLCRETLRMRINDGMSPEDIIEVFVNVIKGLGFAHSQGVVHRDIKPENILFLADDNNAIIGDFGIAHIRKEDQAVLIETKPYDRMANFNYTSPEQRIKGNSKNVTSAADFFSLGIILNEMFTKKIASGSEYTKIADLHPEYKFLDELFIKMNMQDPKKRLSSAKTVIDEFLSLAMQYGKDYSQLIYKDRASEENKEVVKTPLVTNDYRVVSKLRESIHIVVNNVSQDYIQYDWGGRDYFPLFATYKRFTVDYIEKVLSSLDSTIRSHIFDKHIEACDVSDLDGRTLDSHEVKMDALVDLNSLYLSVLKNHKDYLPQFYATVVSILNKNCYQREGTNIVSDEKELPF